MKSPDEIKKGLECRIRSYRDICDHQCDTCDLRIPAYSIYERYEDALALIQQLQDDNAEKDARIQQLESDNQQLAGMLTHMNQLRDAAAGRALQMEERVHQLEVDNIQLLNYIRLLQAERDAAVRDLTEMAQDTDESCEYCKMFKTPHCSLKCRMKNKGFEWRGVQKEE